MNKDILRLAIPNIISNITVPLLGLVDMAIVGHLDSESYIGAIAVATSIFNFIYWNFSFLRMGTSGFTAQAYGAGDKGEQANGLLRSLFISLIGGVCIILLQQFILRLGYFFFDVNADVKQYIGHYFYIYIWAAPAILGLYSFTGWFVGMQDAKTPMFIAIGINVVNIGLCFFFVYVLHMKIEGVALATLCAQYAGFLSAIAIWFYKYGNIKIHFDFSLLKNRHSFIPFFKVNSNIFIRTLALIAVTTFFVSASTREGNDILAMNALMMQLFVLFSYLMDGFAYAAEALTGKSMGSKNKEYLKVLIKYLFGWGFVVALLFTLIYALFFENILGILTDKQHIIGLAIKFKFWVLLIPIAGFSAFLWDGIFVGAMASRQMRNSMLVAVGAFFATYWGIYYLAPTFFAQHENNILWFVFIIYLSFRGIGQSLIAPSILKKVV